jgi:hypothetical protein
MAIFFFSLSFFCDLSLQPALSVSVFDPFIAANPSKRVQMHRLSRALAKYK